MASPLISVVMPVHNGLPFLHESIETILSQTLTDFEFVILDDNSTDDSLVALREWEKRDPRISVYTSTEPPGLTTSSNAVIAKARASVIARMDADDLCEPERLARQWQVMSMDPRIAVVGTLCDGIDARGRRVRPRDRWRLMRRSVFPPFPHGSAMMRRSVLEAVGGYRVASDGYEDQDLFRRMAICGAVVTLPEVLYHYRYHSQSSSLNNDPALIGNPELGTSNLESLYSLGALRLWAGDRPAILSEVFADRANWSSKKFMIASWAIWADLHPASLRSLSRTVVCIRDLLASARISDGRFYEWRFE